MSLAIIEKNIGFKVDEEFYKRIKVKIALEGKTLKGYIIELIKKDLEEKNKETVHSVFGRSDELFLPPRFPYG